MEAASSPPQMLSGARLVHLGSHLAKFSGNTRQVRELADVNRCFCFGLLVTGLSLQATSHGKFNFLQPSQIT